MIIFWRGKWDKPLTGRENEEASGILALFCSLVYIFVFCVTFQSLQERFKINSRHFFTGCSVSISWVSTADCNWVLHLSIIPPTSIEYYGQQSRFLTKPACHQAAAVAGRREFWSLVAQQCECTQHYWAVHFKMVKM